MILLHEKRYEEAIEGFQKASAALPPAEKREDVRLDLLLSQAEAYRLWGHFEESSAILDQVKRDLKKGEVYDPTLAARYWRRRGDLMLSLGRDEEMMNAYRQRLDVMFRFFDPSSEHVLDVCEEIANTLLIAKKRDMLAEFLNDALGRLPSDAKFQSEMYKRFRDYLETLHNYVEELLSEHRWPKAKALLIVLQRIDPEKSGMGELWLHYVGVAVMNKEKGVLTNDAAERIVALSRFYKQNPTVKNLHQEIYCHVTLDYIYRETKQSKLNELQCLSIVNAVEKLLPDKATDYEKIILLEKYSGLTTDALVDSKTSTGLRMLRNMVELSPLPARIKLYTEEHRRGYLDFHVVSRLRLARLCARLGLIEEAEKAFSSIREGPYDKEYPFAQTHVMLAEGYVEAGKIAECKRHLQIAEQMRLDVDYAARANRIKSRLAKLELAPK